MVYFKYNKWERINRISDKVALWLQSWVTGEEKFMNNSSCVPVFYKELYTYYWNTYLSQPIVSRYFTVSLTLYVLNIQRDRKDIFIIYVIPPH